MNARADRKAFVIVNPVAGKHAGENLRESLVRHFTAAGIEYELHETREGDKPGEIVRGRLDEGFDFVVAAGGDGTVSAVIDGLVGSPVPLGIVPLGTGNMVARELGIPLEVDAALAFLAGATRTRKIDAMRIRERIYLLNASVGISADVVDGTSPGLKNRLGVFAYAWTAFVKLFGTKPRRLTVVVDGQALRVQAMEVAVMNCGMVSRIIYPKGPQIRLDDGHLDAWILSTRKLLDVPRHVLGVIARRPARPRAQFLNAERSVTIASPTPLSVQADGDMIGTTPVEVECLPGAFTVFVPEEPAAPPGSPAG